MNKVDLKTYLPQCYEGVVEEEAEQDALSIEMNTLNDRVEMAFMDQFIQKCSIKAIGYYEETFNITADPNTETLEFRKERVLSRMKSLRPPYTYWYLRQMLDRFFGEGNYILDIDNDTYTITLESSATDGKWYHEIQVSLTLIKPCNMIFINTARHQQNLLIGETVTSAASRRNYILDGTWRLGDSPFVTEFDEETRKMATVSSIRQNLINNNLENMQNQIKSVLINNKTVITDLEFSIADSALTIQYGYTVSEATAITNIKLRDADDIVLTDSNVYILVEDFVRVKHVIKEREG